MKKVLIIFPALFCLLLLTGCSKSTEVENGYTSYYITISNNSSYDITELVISLVGIEDIQQISVLTEGEISQRFEFQLPEPSGDIPISYGDYDCCYIQNNEVMYIDIITPDTNILVRINDYGYTVETLFSYFLTITNDSSYDVTEIEIFMQGALGVHQISELNPGEFSQQFEFQLPVPSGIIPGNYGDYIGSYLQNGIENYIFIPLPETNILVHINDDGYTVEDVEN